METLFRFLIFGLQANESKIFASLQLISVLLKKSRIIFKHGNPLGEFWLGLKNIL